MVGLLQMTPEIIGLIAELLLEDSQPSFRAKTRPNLLGDDLLVEQHQDAADRPPCRNHYPETHQQATGTLSHPVQPCFCRSPEIASTFDLHDTCQRLRAVVRQATRVHHRIAFLYPSQLSKWDPKPAAYPWDVISPNTPPMSHVLPAVSAKLDPAIEERAPTSTPKSRERMTISTIKPACSYVERRRSPIC